MAYLLANDTKRRLLSVALSSHWTLDASLSREHQGAFLSLCAQLRQWQFYSRPRGPLWRGRKGIGKEALHVLGEVKRTKNDNIQLGNTFHSKVTRLLKTDLLAVLQELQRQNEVDLALRVFHLVRKEVWYKPDAYLYKDMLHSLARCKRVDECEKLLKDYKLQGLPPDALLLTEVMTAYLECGMLPQAMETFEEMRQGSVPPDLPAFKVLLRYLKKMGKKELRAKIRRECLEFYEGIVDSKHRKRREETDEELEMDSNQNALGEDSDAQELEMEREKRAKYEESDEEELEMDRGQRAKYDESDEDSDTQELEMEREKRAKYEEREKRAKYEESDKEELEMDRGQRAKYYESDEEELVMERHQRAKYKESDEEGLVMERHQRAKYEESDEDELEIVSHQRASYKERDEEEEF